MPLSRLRTMARSSTLPFAAALPSQGTGKRPRRCLLGRFPVLSTGEHRPSKRQCAALRKRPLMIFSTLHVGSYIEPDELMR
uniref:Uncharacterized protein n=1 Tax=Sphaerodactylus townsendi TaxID=933632 RepID=A0ACB8FYG6_9SAUR